MYREPKINESDHMILVWLKVSAATFDSVVRPAARRLSMAAYPRAGDSDHAAGYAAAAPGPEILSGATTTKLGDV